MYSKIDTSRNNFILSGKRKKFMVGCLDLKNERVCGVIQYGKMSDADIHNLIRNRVKSNIKQFAIFCMDTDGKLVVFPVEFTDEVTKYFKFCSDTYIIQRPTCIYSNDGVISIIGIDGAVYNFRWRGLKNMDKLEELVQSGVVSSKAMYLKELPIYFEPKWDEDSGIKKNPRVRI